MSTAKNSTSVWGKSIGFILKIAIAAGIIWYLLLREPQKLLDSLAHFSPIYLLPAMFFYLLHIFFCAWRWRRLANILDVNLSFGEALSLTFQGYFFSLVIPGGAIGGDVVKMGFISQRSQAGKKTDGAFTVLMDRIVGMIALLVLALAILVPSIPILLNVSLPELSLSPGTHKLLIAGFALLCLAGLGACCVIFLHRQLQKFAPIAKLLALLDKLSHGLVGKMTAATDIYNSNWRILTQLIVESIFFVHLMTVVPIFFLLAGLGAEYSFLTAITAVTIGNLVGLLPLFPAGVGGRDVATVTILVAGMIPEETAKTAMLVYTAILLFFNLSGGWFFIFDFGRKPTAESK